MRFTFLYRLTLGICLLSSPAAQAGSGTLYPLIPWTIQLDGEVADIPEGMGLMEVDLADTPKETIRALKHRGVFVLCYFSAGTHENWRADVGAVDMTALGEKLPDWEGETYWDYRDLGVRDVLTARIEQAGAKGCDGIDPDNIDSFEAGSELGLSRGDAVQLFEWMAMKARVRSLKIALKNAPSLLPDVADKADIVVAEQCVEDDFCSAYHDIVAAGKPVLNIEYHPDYYAQPERVCQTSRQHGISTLIMSVGLDRAPHYRCETKNQDGRTR